MAKENLRDTDRLKRFGTLGRKYKIGKGESDIRGWDVVTSDRRKIGKVHDLIVDTEALKVRYLEIEVDRKILGTKTDSRVLVPIAGASLDGEDSRVYINDVTTTKLTAIPAYDGRPITRDYETMLLGLFSTGNDSTGTPTGRDFYDRPDFSDGKFWAERRRGREDSQYLVPGDEEVGKPKEQRR